MTDFDHTAEFRGATFSYADLSGVVIKGCDVTGLRITASDVDDVRISGHAGVIGRVVVNDVDVSEFVGAELDRRHPERLQLRSVKNADDMRAMWDTLEELWAQSRRRAERLPESVLHERVDDEWSFVETLRHLVFAIDVWLGRMISGESLPFHRLGVPSSGYPDDGAREIGIDVDADPSYAEVVEAHVERAEQVRRFLGGLTDDNRAQLRTARPAPAWDEATASVGDCIGVILEEHCEHRRFAERDLAILESR